MSIIVCRVRSHGFVEGSRFQRNLLPLKSGRVRKDRVIFSNTSLQESVSDEYSHFLKTVRSHLHCKHGLNLFLRTSSRIWTKSVRGITKYWSKLHSVRFVLIILVLLLNSLRLLETSSSVFVFTWKLFQTNWLWCLANLVVEELDSRSWYSQLRLQKGFFPNSCVRLFYVRFRRVINCGELQAWQAVCF